MLALVTALFGAARAEAIAPVWLSSGQPVYEARGGDPLEFTVNASPANGEVYKFEFRGIRGQGTVTGLTSTGDATAKATYKAPDDYTGRSVITIRAIDQTSGQFDDVDVVVDVNPKTDLTSGPGVASTPGLTTDNTPTFDFRAVTGQTPSVINDATFECKLDSAEWAACTSPFTAGVLSDGPHTFSVRASKGTDLVDPQPASANFTVDATPPVVNITGGPDTRVKSTSATFTFTNNDPTATVECQLDSGSWEACSSPKAYSGLSQGDHTFRVRATDPAGNAPVASRSWTADTVASVSIDSGPNNGNTDATPTFVFSSPPDDGVGFRCRVYETGQTAPPLSICSSPYTAAALTKNVSYTFEVQVTDGLGNTDSKTRVWTQSNTAPSPGSPTVTVSAGDTATVDLSSGATDADSDALGSYTVTTGGSGGIGLDGSRITPGTADSNSGSVQVPTAANAAGTYTFSFTVSDGRQGGTSTGTATVRVRPDTKEITDPTQPTNDSTPQWTFTAVAETADFECQLLDANNNDSVVTAWTGCFGGSYAPSVADGKYKIQVRAKLNDLVDDSPLTSGVVEVDTVSPSVSLDGPSALLTDSDLLSNTADPAFTFSTTDPDPRVTFECRTDEDTPGTWKACTSGAAYTGMTDGNRTFNVRAKDAAGNVSLVPGTFSWERDTTEPEFEITSGPDDGEWTNLRRPTWEYTESDPNPITDDKNLLPATTTCKINAGTAVNDCPSTWTAPSFLNDGDHTLTLTVQDTAGNTGEAVIDFKVATTSPPAFLEETPDNPSGTGATFTFMTTSELGPTGKFQCRTSANGGSFSQWATCTSPFSPPNLQNGVNTFQVRAVDSAGNSGSGPFVASHTWNVLASPTAQLTATRTGFDNAAFRFISSNDPLATFECRLDSGTWAACTSPKTYSGLTPGAHTFQVRAVNEVATGQAAQHNWTATAPAAPNTEITRRPAATTALTTASFEFISDDPLATFECKLDDGNWGGCDSPKAYEGLANGQHTFAVRASNGSGQTDSSPASWTWTVADQTVEPVPGLLATSVKAPRSVRAGRAFNLRVNLRNGGTEDALGTRVCLVSNKAMILGDAVRCKTVDVGGQTTATVSFRVSTRAGMSGQPARFRTIVKYSSAGVGKKEYIGHVTLMK